jgi:hypothetical protein
MIKLLSSFAFNFNLRRYSKVDEAISKGLPAIDAADAPNPDDSGGADAGAGTGRSGSGPGHKTAGKSATKAGGQSADSVCRFPRRPLTPCPQLCMGISPSSILGDAPKSAY